jgi:membrane protein YqaA with SNARE-associated domain
MKTAAKKGIYIGAGAGLILFAILGLLPGSFVGGVLGLNIARSIYGMPLEPALIPRIIVGVSMLLGVLLAGLVFVVGSSIVGWLIGSAIDSIRHTRAAVVKTK